MWTQGNIYTPLAVLLQLKRLSTLAPGCPGLSVSLIAMPKRAYIKHSVGKPCMSEAYAKWNQNNEPAINTGGSDSKRPTRLANTGRDGGNGCTRPTLLGCIHDREARPLSGQRPSAPDCGVQLPDDSAQRAAQWMRADAQRLPCCPPGFEQARQQCRRCCWS